MPSGPSALERSRGKDGKRSTSHREPPHTHSLWHLGRRACTSILRDRTLTLIPVARPSPDSCTSPRSTTVRSRQPPPGTYARSYGGQLAGSGLLPPVGLYPHPIERRL